MRQGKAVKVLFLGQPILDKGLFVADDVPLPAKRGEQIVIVPNESEPNLIDIDATLPLRLRFCNEIYAKGFFRFTPEFRTQIEKLSENEVITHEWHGANKQRLRVMVNRPRDSI